MNGRYPVWLQKWLDRHRSRVSLWLHAVGIPMTIAAVVLGCRELLAGHWVHWYHHSILFVAGYALQFLGHVHEGNDMGEVILIKRLLRRPYTAVSPRYAPEE